MLVRGSTLGLLKI